MLHSNDFLELSHRLRFKVHLGSTHHRSIPEPSETRVTHRTNSHREVRRLKLKWCVDPWVFFVWIPTDLIFRHSEGVLLPSKYFWLCLVQASNSFLNISTWSNMQSNTLEHQIRHESHCCFQTMVTVGFLRNNHLTLVKIFWFGNFSWHSLKTICHPSL